MNSSNHMHFDDDNSAEELIALLGFTIKHNVLHLRELTDLAAKIEQTGNLEAAEIIRSAVNKYDEGNVLLKEALNAVK